MSNVWFCSDLHLGHDNAIKWRNQFSTPEEHDDFMIEGINSVLDKRDTLYVLGDSAVTTKGFEKLPRINDCFKKVLVLGNHDIERGIKLMDFFQEFDAIHSLLPYKGFWLSHAPIHPDELRGKINLHGHVHDATITMFGMDEIDTRYFNMCPENLVPLVGRPIISLTEIRGFYNV